MTSVTDDHGQDDAGNWKTLKTIVFVAGIAFALFAAGVNFGSVKDTAQKLEAYQSRGEQLYVRKDGMELATIQAQLKALNDKMDYMIRQGAR